MSGLFRSDLVANGVRKQLKQTIEHPVKTLRSALPSRGRLAGRVARTAGVIALTTARSHPVVWGVAIVVAVGVGWLYLRRQRQSESKQDAPTAEAQQAQERKPSKANKRGQKRRVSDEAPGKGSNDDSHERPTKDEVATKPRRRKSAGGSRSRP
ncbi:MAG: hypothetical protein MEQ07_11575 [Aquimonas sp.]|nr:hypothetical protein [Aquimonas sp.]